MIKNQALREHSTRFCLLVVVPIYICVVGVFVPYEYMQHLLRTFLHIPLAMLIFNTVQHKLGVT